MEGVHARAEASALWPRIPDDFTAITDSQLLTKLIRIEADPNQRCAPKAYHHQSACEL